MFSNKNLEKYLTKGSSFAPFLSL